ncbi:MAG TPA: zinc-binding dehydrogenase [Bacillota bacterium]
MPGTMKALVRRQGRVQLEDRPLPVPGRGQVRVRLVAAALNHRDLKQARRADAPAVVLGSDGAGVLDAVGPGTDLTAAQVAIGDEVVINPSLGWLDEPAAPPPGYQILGDPSDGTFAEYVVVPLQNVEPKPRHLSWEEAAAFPLAALTAYRALVTRAQLRPGETVVIPGIGGGAALFALQIAKAIGARAFVTSRSPEKLERARQLGADALLRSDEAWDEQVRALTGGRGADVVVETVGLPTWSKSLACLADGGRLVFFASGPVTGNPEASAELPIRRTFFAQLSLLGTRMGNRAEFRELLKLMERGAVRPVIDSVFSLADFEQAFERLQQGVQFGKIVLRIGGTNP